ncbi:hypothetical protein SAMN02746066_03716 [Anaerosporobacter mobilis DSM 15930]|uniref:Uncharacterized protein n=1 Tax=Anaerosporobacter mobilis DSM 15930 TaxID=1120996 RepID=A0A1M7MAV1_9FIRM|nr:hypothetical protein [Anaerosporobacter mobilis]SHM87947.1 hypothetical protein SAMN02746066_03716 [Anaerosporobacter mobilis DSM 15930]
MDIFYQTLYIIHKEYQKFLGTKSLVVLRAFIDGYVNREMEINPSHQSNFWKFNNFVASFYNDDINMNWDRILTAHTKTDEEAFDKFFYLLDKFLEKEPN